MKKRVRVFKNPVVLNQMLQMRLAGYPLKELSFIFSCDHTSVRKMCLKHGIEAKVPLLPRPVIIFKPVFWDFDGERINAGKSYKEYRLEAKIRHNRPPIGGV